LVKFRRMYTNSEDKKESSTFKRNRKCYTCGEDGHFACNRSCPKYDQRRGAKSQNSKNKKSINLVENSNNEEGDIFEVVIASVDIGEGPWYLDSGATTHLLATKKS
jgi:hypothetical protein